MEGSETQEKPQGSLGIILVVLAASGGFFFGVYVLVAHLEANRISAQVNKLSSQLDSQGLPPKPIYTTDPIDLAAASLPPFYAGHDIAALYWNLTDQTHPKGEYETTEQFTARIRAAVPKDLFAFKIERDIYSSIFTYDADVRLLRIAVPTSDLDSPVDTKTIVVKEKRESTREYPAANAYGAQVQVTEYRIEDFRVAVGEKYVRESRARSIGFMKNTLALNIPMAPELAQKRKAALELLLIGKAKLLSGSPQIAYSNFSSRDATISNPVALVHYRHCINVDLLEVWVYDHTTGEVLKKHKVAA